MQAGFKKTPEEIWMTFLKDPSYISANAGGAPGRNSVIYSQPVTGYIIVVLANYDEPIAEQVGENIYRLLAGKEVEKPGQNIFRTLYLIYNEKGAQYLKNNFSEIIKDASFDMEEDFLLNRVGYDLLGEDRTKEAIEIFKKLIQNFFLKLQIHGIALQKPTQKTDKKRKRSDFIKRQ